MKLAPTVCLALLIASCGRPGSDKTAADLTTRPDQWVQSITAQPDTKAEYVGKTSPVLSSTTVKSIPGVRTVAIGDTLNGVTIGAIKCSFFPHDANDGGEQFMWRGRWGCMAGRSKSELDNAVKDDGTKMFDYIHLAPVSL